MSTLFGNIHRPCPPVLIAGICIPSDGQVCYTNDFHDITVGNNQLVGTPVGFNAAAGYDFATGWGTPNVANLVSDLPTA